MWILCILVGVVLGSMEDSVESPMVQVAKPKELKDLPISFFPEASAVSYTKYSETEIQYHNEPTEVQVFVSSSEPHSIVAFEDDQVHCLDEFVGFTQLTEKKIEHAIKNSNYNFCTNNGESISADNYEIEHKLICDQGDWTRLDCKFIPKGKPESAFIASRVGKRRSTVGRVFRKVTDPAAELFVDRVQGFTDRVKCEKQLEKDQISECHSLLLSWTLLDNALGSSRKAKAAAPAVDAEEPSTEKGDEKSAEKKKDELYVEEDVNTSLYVGAGVLVLLVILIGVSLAMGNKKKEREELDEMRHHRKREQKETEPGQDDALDGPASAEKRSHRHRHRKDDAVESPTKNADEAAETPVAEKHSKHKRN